MVELQASVVRYTALHALSSEELKYDKPSDNSFIRGRVSLVLSLYYWVFVWHSIFLGGDGGELPSSSEYRSTVESYFIPVWSRLFYFCAAQEVVRGNHQNSHRLVLDQFGYSVEYPVDLVPVIGIMKSYSV